MSNYKCKCGNTSDFFIEHNLSQCGLYCGCCGKWIKWLNKDEERLFKHKQNDAKIINKFVANAMTEFQKFDKEHGYPTLSDISVILCDVAEQLKEQSNEQSV